MQNLNHSNSELIVIVGPTCVGKSKITQKLIEVFPIEVINLDSFMVYSHFSIGTGRYDVSHNRRHLYGFLNPMEFLSNHEYIKLVKIAINQILINGNIPVFEGGSLTYLQYITDVFRLRIIGILPKDQKSLKENIEDRLDPNQVNHILKEVREGLQLGYRNSRILQDDIVYLPLVEVLDGKLTLAEARDRIKNNLSKMTSSQLQGYKAYEIEWINSHNAFQFFSALFANYTLDYENSFNE